MKKKSDQQVETLQKQIEELKAKYLRALADYQNLEKRATAEKEETRKFAVELFLKRLLSVVDTFERAQQHLNDHGLALALKEVSALLEEYKVVKMEVVGKIFNPHEMECLEVVKGEENKVIEEILPGYRLREKVLRVAQVKVGKKDI